MMLNLLRSPDHAVAFTDNGQAHLTGAGEILAGGGIELRTTTRSDVLHIDIAAAGVALQRLRLRWGAEIGGPGVCLLGDAWERGYGDLHWSGIVPERHMPWYVLIHDPVSETTAGFGVRTGCAALAAWRVDETGVTLWLDVRSGGLGVHLADRTLRAAEVVFRPGIAGQSPFAAARELCRALCPAPRLPRHAVYGGNNWYYAYGNSSHEQILRDTDLLVDLSPAGDNRPYMTIDDGWQQCRGNSALPCTGPWVGQSKFPDMSALAHQMAQRGARPGIWIRPLAVEPGTPPALLLPDTRAKDPAAMVPTLDPSLSESLAMVSHDMQRLRAWGYALVKHDFTTFDLLGRWGFNMLPETTNGGWHFADRSKTTAEIICTLYQTIREALGEEVIVIGCNTIGHLGAGLFDLQRTGDDTSGRQWERTRRMGPNTLAFRMPQHDAFFAADADCVGLTPNVPWHLNRQWLDLLARSGTPLFVSAAPEAVGPEQRAALKTAFAAASEKYPMAEPLDWMDSTCPRRWRIEGQIVTYDWVDSGLALNTGL
jgi:alpha-galactosidase